MKFRYPGFKEVRLVPGKKDLGKYLNINIKKIIIIITVIINIIKIKHNIIDIILLYGN